MWYQKCPQPMRLQNSWNTISQERFEKSAWYFVYVDRDLRNVEHSWTMIHEQIVYGDGKDESVFFLHGDLLWRNKIRVT